MVRLAGLHKDSVIDCLQASTPKVPQQEHHMGWEMPGEDLEERLLVPSLEVVPLLRIHQTDRLLQQVEEDFQRQEVVEELGAGRT